MRENSADCSVQENACAAAPANAASGSQAKGKKRGECLEKARTMTETIFLRVIIALSCFVVFISGFFINIGFMPMEQVQAKLSISQSGSVTLEGMLSDVSFNQNVFNVVDALLVPVGGDGEAEGAIYDALSSRVTEVAGKYDTEIASLLAQAESDSRAVEKLIKLYEKIVTEITNSVTEINLVKLDRLEAENAYYDNSESLGQSGGGTVSEKVIKRADDSLIRTAVLAGFPVGTIYLQVVALVCLILELIAIFSKANNSVGEKFYFLYLGGFIFLFLIAQLSATTVAGAGMFCFVFAAVMMFLYLAGRIFVTRGIKDGGKIASLSLNGLAAVLSFVMLCLLFGASFEFGGIIKKVGAVFGLHTFDSTTMASGEGMIMTIVNFAVVGGLYLLSMVALSLLFYFTFVRLCKGKAIETPDIVLAAVSAGLPLVAYIALYVISAVGVVELLYAPSSYLVIGVVGLCVLAIVLLEPHILKTIGDAKKKEGPEEESVALPQN